MRRAAAALIVSAGLLGLLRYASTFAEDPGTPGPSDYVFHFELDPDLTIDNRMIGGR